MTSEATARLAREETRARERAVWADVERVGRDLRQANTTKQSMTQAETDVTRKRPKEGLGI